ncbi:hypothetical protein O3P69_008989 [Scylla paramamosain]|uniref:Choline transporter-like protein n=2 Tax=Scylla paramamosain TaxID=85552 RepID=A0AAW0TQ61_SCYPA
MTGLKGKVNGKVLVPPESDEDQFTGPLHERQCRDVLFLLLFIAFVFGAIGYLVFVSLKADPARLWHGHDKYGNVCGRKNDPLLDLAGSGKDFSDSPFCEVYQLSDVVEGVETNEAPCKTCVENCSKKGTQIAFYCTKLNLTNVGERTDIATKAIFGTSLSDFFETAGRDLDIAGTSLAILAVIAIALGLVFILMLRFLAQVVVWITILAMVVGSIGGTAYLWVQWYLHDQKLKKERENGAEFLGGLETFVRNLMIGAIVATIFTLLLLALLIAMRNRIRLVIALFKEAGKAVAAMPLLMFQPLWTCLWLCVVGIVWVAGFALILTAGEPRKKNDGVIFVTMPFIEHMRWYHVFAFLWVTQFILACQDVTIAGAVAQWYFTRNKKLLGWPILTSMKRLFRYHLGSVAFGSLLIAIVKFIRVIFKYLEKRLSGTTNQFCSFCLKCCQCCLWCFEKFLKFLSRNAYIEIAIYGYSFCKAAQKAFSLLVSNALRVAAINSVGAFVLILTKLSIVAITIAIGYVILRTKQELTYIWVPLLIVFIYSYFIAHCFISVYEMCIDTLFLCFCEDCERNDGINSPYYMSRGLMQFVENSKKALEALEARQKEGRLAQAVRKPSAVRPATAIRPTTAVSTTMISGAPAIPSPAHYITPAA